MSQDFFPLVRGPGPDSKELLKKNCGMTDEILDAPILAGVDWKPVYEICVGYEMWWADKISHIWQVVALSGDREFVEKYFTENEGLKSACDKEGRTVVHYLAMSNSLACMEWFLERNPEKLTEEDNCKNHALNYAVRAAKISGTSPLAEFLKEKGLRITNIPGYH